MFRPNRLETRGDIVLFVSARPSQNLHLHPRVGSFSSRVWPFKALCSWVFYWLPSRLTRSHLRDRREILPYLHREVLRKKLPGFTLIRGRTIFIYRPSSGIEFPYTRLLSKPSWRGSSPTHKQVRNIVVLVLNTDFKE